MKTIALCLLLVACGKKAEEAPKADPTGKPDPVAATPEDAAVAVMQAIYPDAGGGKRTATVDSITDGTATMTLVRNLVDGSPPVKVTMKLPAGWKQSETRRDHEVIFIPEGGKYDRPSITMKVQLDNLDPAKLTREVAEEITEKAAVVGLGKIKVLATHDRPDGKLITRHVDATKERDINYVETICFVTKPGQNFVVQMLGFVDKGKDDVALVKAFEEACPTVTIVEP
jgi:hypothetical protein